VGDAQREADRAGIGGDRAPGLGVKREDVKDGCVIRQYKAYPVYDGEYRQHLKVLEDYIRSFENLQTVGRNGMHRYNNQDHSMLSALLAPKTSRAKTTTSGISTLSARTTKTSPTKSGRSSSRGRVGARWRVASPSCLANALQGQPQFAPARTAELLICICMGNPLEKDS
jgi:hypothetical protein